MKTHVLAAAIALLAGAALAQTPAEKAPANPGSNTANTAGSTTAATGSNSENKADAKPASTKKSAKKASSKKKGTQSMGAGPVAPETDLGASARQTRIEAAYANWQANPNR